MTPCVSSQQVSRQQQIEELFAGRWYVPVLADEENGVSSVSGPWCPETCAAPASPIVALAGPMTLQDATSLYSEWADGSQGTIHSNIRAF